MRTVEEIEADIKSAIVAEREARDRLASLYEEKAATELANTGLGGHLVSYSKGSWKMPARTVRFVVDRFKWGGFEGRVVLADGSLGLRRTYADPKKITDHGLWSDINTGKSNANR